MTYVPVEAKDSNATFTVVIDAGHGGKDVGATDNGVMEKNINLGVAKQLQQLIKKKLKDVKVVMTRDNDSYLTLQERADVANGSKGDLFISIHTNSVDKKNKNRKTVKGSSVYALGLHKDDNNMAVAQRENSVIELESDYETKYSGFDPMKDESYIIFEMAQKKNLSKSIKFAEEVEKELVASGRADRGVHQAGFWVLWATSMPSVLIELDFICNPESASYISSEKGAGEMAEAIFKAVKKYYEGWEKENDNLMASANENKRASAKTNSDNKKESKGKGKDLKPEKAKVSENVLINEELAENIVSETVISETIVSEYAVASARKKKREPSQLKKNTQTGTSPSSRNTSGRRRSNSARQNASSANYEGEVLILGSIADNGNSSDIFEEEVPTNKLTEKERKAAEKAAKKEQKRLEKELKERQKKEKKQRDREKHSAKISKMRTVYKIQILASTSKLKQSDSRFCGLSPVSVVKDSDKYKYFYGESSDREEMETLLRAVRKKIPDAFIVSLTKGYNK